MNTFSPSPGVRILLAAYLSLVTVSLHSNAASLSADKPLEEMLIRQWTTRDGLPMNQINRVATTSDGYVWLATYEGLARFDGLTFRVWNHNDSDALIGGVWDLVADSEDNLWLFDANTRHLVRFSGGKFTRWPVGNIVDLQDFMLFRDWSGNVVIRGKQTFFRIENEQLTAVDLIPPESFEVQHALFADDGSLWIVGIDGSVTQYLDGEKVSHLSDYTASFVSQNGHSDVTVTLIDGGIAEFVNGKWMVTTNQDFPAISKIWSTYREESGTLWIGTDAGLFRFLNNRHERLEPVGSDPVDQVYSVAQATDGTLFFGTFNDGLKQLNESEFRIFSIRNGLPGAIVNSIVEDKDSIVVATNAGVARIQNNQIKPFLNGRFDGIHTSDVLPIDKDDYWVSSMGQGAFHYKRGQLTQYGLSNGLPSDTIYKMASDAEGGVWFGTLGGVARYLNGRFDIFTTREGLNSNLIFSIFHDDHERLWMSGGSGGLALWDGNGFHTPEGSELLQKQTIFHLSQTATGDIWGGYQGGVLRIRNGVVKAVDLTHTFPRTGIFHAWAAEGGLWLTTGSGVFRLELTAVNAAIERGSADLHFRSLLQRRGLPGNATTALGRALNESNKRFWIPLQKGVAVLDPATVFTTLAPPTVYIDQVTINGKPAMAEENFQTGMGSLRFEFQAPAFDLPEQLVYITRLEGFDDWSSATAERQATYTNLPPAEYTFYVRVAYRDGEFGEPATYSFSVEPAFYQTLWFYLLIATMLFSIGFASNSLRLRQLRLRAEQLEKQVQLRTNQLQLRTEELATEKEKAEAANRAKSTFLANMSHELRTPLNAIIGFTQLMESTSDVNVEDRRHLSIVNESGRYLLGMINDILELSRIEAGRATLAISNFDLAQQLDLLISMMTMRAKEKSLQLTHDVDGRVPQYIAGDHNKLHQVLINLMGNAIKFTDEGSVSLKVTRLSGTDSPSIVIRFSVEDTGPGMSEEFLQTLFDPFARAESNKEGTGLGLAISFDFIQLMGSELKVESHPGEGSRFYFDLTTSEHDAANGQEPVARQQIVVGLKQTPESYQGLPPRVLVVDDDENSQLLLSLLLKNVGFDVRTAGNGTEAITSTESWQPHFIWLDLRLPDIQGDEVAARLKKLYGDKTPVIAAITAHTYDGLGQRALDNGCSDLVLKPFDEREIYEVMARRLGIEFRYEDRHAGPVSQDIDAETLRVRVQSIEPGLRAGLINEIDQCDLDAILLTIAKVRESDPATADALEHLANNYDFDQLARTFDYQKISD